MYEFSTEKTFVIYHCNALQKNNHLFRATERRMLYLFIFSDVCRDLNVPLKCGVNECYAENLNDCLDVLESPFVSLI